jgi:hypothetical protein
MKWAQPMDGRPTFKKEKTMLSKIIEHRIEILAVALALSEALALIPALKANGILDGIIKTLKALKSEPSKGE